MAKLLYQARSHRIGTGYAAELLSAMGNAFGSALPPTELLIEPLTLRELEVLKLIEAGCSNQEIAAELVISMPTVKRHISNIYAKLGASSRTQAVLRGKELNLFQ
jgi:LuxR family maltose regulon positive regulatory protein